MSKASEYVRLNKEALVSWPRMSMIRHGINANAEVTSDGSCRLVFPSGAVLMTGKQALELAHWIIDTFEDPPVTGGEPGLGQ